MVEDWGFIEGFLLGQGLTEREAREVTYKQLNSRLEAVQRQQSHDWEVMRWAVFNLYLLSPDLKRGDKPKKPQDLFKLHNEREHKVEKVIISDEELKALKEIGLWG